ncbi:hypothetical protein ACRQ5D_30720 [Mucilaginibacter sp. P25]|uniref:Carboxypeptidase regulatory-like domain-containing protein n=1 Tax=Mucilaginibacter gossypii TaxID=551996 RepID=A0A1G7SHL0_9SPHI|nr:hypothetical protein [Mucilaginibacter gossypii]SDG21710.1 hypothetical protein SAMN05192573_102541 [Mucilaginibacter gossypii]
MKLNRLIILCFAVLFFYGCRKGENAKEIIPALTPGPGAAEIGLSGDIKNPDGSAAEGVDVTIDGHKITTSASGLFEYTGKVSNADKVKLSISKKGYFKFSKTFTLEENSTIENLSYLLVLEQTVGSFGSASGGTITTTYATLVFQPNSFVNQDGSAYNGNVTVKMPPNIISEYADKLPGDTRALTATNQKVVLDHWGGMNVQVYGNTGQLLKLVKPVNYTYKIDWRYVYINKSNPIKIWSYDEADDIWKEAGDATLNGQYFTGSTTSLSYLQWGTAYPQALLRAYVTDGNSNPASFFRLGCGIDNYAVNSFSGVRINSKGVALIYVPANTQIRTAVASPCYDMLNAFLIPPIAVDKKLEQPLVVNLALYITTFEGKIEDCGFNGVKGRAEFTFNGKKMLSNLDNNGYFKFTFLLCQFNGYNGKLVVYDEQNKIIHQNSNNPIRAGIKNAYLASLCTVPQAGKVTINVNGKTYTFETPKDSLSMSETFEPWNGSPTTMISAHSADRTQGFLLTYLGFKGGKVDLYTCGFSIPSNNYTMTWGLYERGTTQITKYKTSDTLIEGTFKTKTNLNFSVGAPGEVVEISGSFNISR